MAVNHGEQVLQIPKQRIWSAKSGNPKRTIKCKLASLSIWSALVWGEGIHEAVSLDHKRYVAKPPISDKRNDVWRNVESFLVFLSANDEFP